MGVDLACGRYTTWILSVILLPFASHAVMVMLLVPSWSLTIWSHTFVPEKFPFTRTSLIPFLSRSSTWDVNYLAWKYFALLWSINYYLWRNGIRNFENMPCVTRCRIDIITRWMDCNSGSIFYFVYKKCTVLFGA